MPAVQSVQSATVFVVPPTSFLYFALGHWAHELDPLTYIPSPHCAQVADPTPA